MAKEGNLAMSIKGKPLAPFQSLFAYVEHESRGTSYRLALVDLPERVAKREGGKYLVILLSPNNKAYPFNHSGFLHWTYVAEKLDLGETDARTVAWLIGQLLDIEAEKPAWIGEEA